MYQLQNVPLTIQGFTSQLTFHTMKGKVFYQFCDNDRDPQQVERKRHIGNDVSVIVFLEKGTKYRLLTF
jgi:hypothetical protein